jgi:hypothetical protein
LASIDGASCPKKYNSFLVSEVHEKIKTKASKQKT